MSERVGATVTSWRDRNPRGGESSKGLHGADQAERVVNWVVVSYLPIRMK